MVFNLACVNFAGVRIGYRTTSVCRNNLATLPYLYAGVNLNNIVFATLLDSRTSTCHAQESSCISSNLMFYGSTPLKCILILMLVVLLFVLKANLNGQR